MHRYGAVQSPLGISAAIIPKRMGQIMERAGSVIGCDMPVRQFDLRGAPRDDGRCARTGIPMAGLGETHYFLGLNGEK